MLQRSNILTFPLNYFVNGPVKLALVVWKATEGKSVIVVHDVSCAGNSFPCLGCKPPGSGVYNGWGVMSCPWSSNTWRSKHKNEWDTLFYHKNSHIHIHNKTPITCTVFLGVWAKLLSRTLLSLAELKLFPLIEVLMVFVMLWFTRNTPEDTFSVLDDLEERKPALANKRRKQTNSSQNNTIVKD